MKNAYYFTCGPTHSHYLGDGITWNKDSVLQVNAPQLNDAVEHVVSLFGYKWAMSYDNDIDLSFYPNGICCIINI